MAHQLAVHITRRFAHGHDHVTVALHPEELGLVRVSLELGDPAGPRALISVDRPETLEMLRRDSHQLEQSLREAGIGLGSAGIGFSLRQDGSPRQEGQAPGAPRSTPAGEREEAPAWAPASAPTHRPSRLLDLEI